MYIARNQLMAKLKPICNVLNISKFYLICQQLLEHCWKNIICVTVATNANASNCDFGLNYIEMRG